MNRNLRNIFTKEMTLFFCLVVLSFIPFYFIGSYDRRGTMLFDFFYGIFYYLNKFEFYSQQPELIAQVIQQCVDVVALYIVIIVLIVLAITIKKGKYRYLFNLSAIFMLIINFVARFAVYSIRLNGRAEHAYLSWAFYLAMALFVLYAFSPLYFKKLSVFFRKLSVFFKKRIELLKAKHPRKPTKADQISDLQRQIDELKKEDTNNSISSKED